MKIIAFAASSSKQSINKKLATYAASLLEGHEIEILDLNDYEMPIFSSDKEEALGQPEQAKAFYKKIGEADALIISFAEHNASYTAAYKNLYDWTSRIDMKVYQNKPAVLLATSPGPGGAKNVLETAKQSAPYFGLDVKADLSIGKFFDVFDLENQTIKDQSIQQDLATAVSKLSI